MYSIFAIALVIVSQVGVTPSSKHFDMPLNIGPAGLDPRTPGYLGIGVFPIGTSETLPPRVNVATCYIGPISYMDAGATSEVGMVIVTVDKDSAAQRIGLHTGDWVQAVDGNFTGSFLELVNRLHACWESGYGDARLSVRRGNQILLIATEPLRGERELYVVKTDVPVASPTVKSPIKPPVKSLAPGSSHVLADTVTMRQGNDGNDEFLVYILVVVIILLIGLGWWTRRR